MSEFELTERVAEEDVEHENSDDLAIALGDFDDLFVVPSDWTISSLVNVIENQVDLDPEFQRRNVWSKAAKSRFIESIFLNVPIPQILLASHKNSKTKFLVLDGKQRLLAIKQFIDGEFDDGKVFKLTGLRYLTDLHNKSWSQISKEENWGEMFLSRTQRTTIMKGWNKEGTLYEIFYRLNSGSVKLSPMELRMSLHPGEFLKFMIKWTEKMRPIHRLLRLSDPDKRMADVELTIKHLAFLEPEVQYDGNLKGYIDSISILYNERFNEEWRDNVLKHKLMEFGNAINAAIQIFGKDDVCRKYKDDKFEGRFNRAVYDIIIGSLHHAEVRNWALENSEQFKQAFIDVSAEDPEFVNSFETSTKNVKPTTHRFRTWFSKVEAISGIPVPLPNIVQRPDEDAN